MKKMVIKFKEIKIYRLFFILMIISNYAHSQSLEFFLNEAEKTNPEINSLRYLEQQKKEKINEVGTLENTKLSFGYFLQEPETRVGAQRAKFSVAQSFPWFGFFRSLKSSEKSTAKAFSEKVKTEQRNLRLKVKITYYHLLELHAKKSVLDSILSLYKTYQSIVEGQIESSQSSVVQLLKIQIDENDTKSQRHTIQESLIAMNKAMNLLLNRDENDTILIDVSKYAHLGKERFPNIALLDAHPAINELSHKEEALQESLIANKKAGMPKITLGLDYVLVDELPLPSLVDNGKDVLMPMVSVSIPLFSKKYRSKSKQIILQKQAIQESKKNVINGLRTNYHQQLNLYKSAVYEFKKIQDNQKQIDLVRILILSEFENGKKSFDQVLETDLTQYKFKIKEIETKTKILLSQASLEYLTGANY